MSWLFETKKCKTSHMDRDSKYTNRQTKGYEGTFSAKATAVGGNKGKPGAHSLRARET